MHCAKEEQGGGYRHAVHGHRATLGLLPVSRARRHTKVGAPLSFLCSPFCQAWGQSSVISARMQGE